jgi:hypothetical protein
MFYSKGSRLDSRCKKCVSKAKANHYAKKRAKVISSERIKRIRQQKFVSVVVGTLSDSVMENTSTIFGNAIRGVLNGGTG